MEPTPVQAWKKCLSNVEERVDQQSFCTWLKPTRAIGWEDESLLVGVPNSFVADWLKRHYHEMLNDSLASITSPPRKVVFRITSNVSTTEERPAVQQQAAEIQVDTEVKALVKNTPPVIINPRYTFDTFVVGESNEFSHAASMAVAESPGILFAVYHLLFLFPFYAESRYLIPVYILLCGFSAYALFIATRRLPRIFARRG